MRSLDEKPAFSQKLCKTVDHICLRMGWQTKMNYKTLFIRICFRSGYGNAAAGGSIEQSIGIVFAPQIKRKREETFSVKHRNRRLRYFGKTGKTIQFDLKFTYSLDFDERKRIVIGDPLTCGIKIRMFPAVFGFKGENPVV